MVKCYKCKQDLFKSAFTINPFTCDECIRTHFQEKDTIIEYCEPCAKLDATAIEAIEQIDETWVCKRCAHAIRFMKEQERIQINIWIRSGKCPF